VSRWLFCYQSAFQFGGLPAPGDQDSEASAAHAAAVPQCTAPSAMAISPTCAKLLVVHVGMVTDIADLAHPGCVQQAAGQQRRQRGGREPGGPRAAARQPPGQPAAGVRAVLRPPQPQRQVIGTLSLSRCLGFSAVNPARRHCIQLLVTPLATWVRSRRNLNSKDHRT
jgi:hypothetical protein